MSNDINPATPLAMSSTRVAALQSWSSRLKSTETAGLAAIRVSQVDAFVNLLNDYRAFGAELVNDYIPEVATILGVAASKVTGANIRKAMATQGTTMYVDGDTRATFPSASTMSRAIACHRHDTDDRRAQWMDATDDDGKRNPLRVQDYVQVASVAGGEPYGNKSQIDWDKSLIGGKHNRATSKVTGKPRIGLLTRVSRTGDDNDTETTETTDASVVIPSQWRDLFAMSDDALTATRDDADGYDVNDFPRGDWEGLARQLLAAIALEQRAASRVSA